MAPLELIDTHAHLDEERFAPDLPEVLQRARSAGVVQVVTIATTAASTRKALSLARQYPQLFPSAGLHPNHAAEAAPGDWDEIERLAGLPEVVALGETGLDRHWDFTPFPLQEDYFARHLTLARRLDKPIIIHCREAESDVLRMLREDYERFGPLRGVMHSFSADQAMADACLSMGLVLSFAGMITYKNAEALRTVARTIPGQRLMVETDSPYLSPVPHRGQRNEPAYVRNTAVRLAEVRGETLEVLAAQTTATARRLFRIPQ